MTISIIFGYFCFAWCAMAEVEIQTSRGILIPIGMSPMQFAGAWAAYKMLREQFNCSLPVELWSYQREVDNMPLSVHEAVKNGDRLSLKAISREYDFDETQIPNWDVEQDWYTDYKRYSSMAHALLGTELDEIIAIDADTMLLSSPDMLFETKQYGATGTLFFWDKLMDYWPTWYPPYDPDWLPTFLGNYTTRTLPEGRKRRKFTSAPSDPDMVKSLIEERYLTQHSMDSSILAFNRRRLQRALGILRELTIDHGMEVYQHIYGDKETYWMAVHLANAGFSFSNWAAAHWSHGSNYNGLEVCVGNKYIEPGHLHYLPDLNLRKAKVQSYYENKYKTEKVKDSTNTQNYDVSVPELLSLNECKSIGCVPYGARKLKCSAAMSRNEHKKTYFTSIHNMPLSRVSGNLPVGTRATEKGRETVGVRRYHDKWYKQVTCEHLPQRIYDMLIQQRIYMQEGMRIFCAEKSFCRKIHRKGKGKRKMNRWQTQRQGQSLK